MAVKTQKTNEEFDVKLDGLERLIALTHLIDSLTLMAKAEAQNLDEDAIKLFHEQAKSAGKNYDAPQMINAGDGRARAGYVLRRRAKNKALSEDEVKLLKKNGVAVPIPAKNTAKKVNPAHSNHAKLTELVAFYALNNPGILPEDILVNDEQPATIVTDEVLKAVLKKKAASPDLISMVGNPVITKPLIIGENPTEYAWSVVSKMLAEPDDEADVPDETLEVVVPHKVAENA